MINSSFNRLNTELVFKILALIIKNTQHQFIKYAQQNFSHIYKHYIKNQPEVYIPNIVHPQILQLQSQTQKILRKSLNNANFQLYIILSRINPQQKLEKQHQKQQQINKEINAVINQQYLLQSILIQIWQLNITSSISLQSNNFSEDHQNSFQIENQENQIKVFQQSLLNYLSIHPIIKNQNINAQNQKSLNKTNQNKKYIKIFDIQNYRISWRLQEKYDCHQSNNQNIDIAVKQFFIKQSQIYLKRKIINKILFQSLNQITRKESSSSSKQLQLNSVFEKVSSKDKLSEDISFNKKLRNSSGQLDIFNKEKNEESTKSIRKTSIYQLHDQQLEVTLISKNSESLQDIRQESLQTGEQQKQKYPKSPIKEIQLQFQKKIQKGQSSQEEFEELSLNTIDSSQAKWLRVFEILLKDMENYQRDYFNLYSIKKKITKQNK